MAITRMIDICCDVCSTYLDDDRWTVSEVREAARSEGWHRSKGRDICEDCWELGER